MRNLLFYVWISLGFFAGCIPPGEKNKSAAKANTEVGYASVKDLSTVKVGYCTPSLDASFYVALENAVKNTVLAYGMQYLTTDGQADIAKQVIAVEDLLAKGIDVLILNPIDPQALTPIVKMAREQGVAVFVVDSYIEEEAPYISAVVADNQMNGELLGAWIIKNIKTDLNIAVISGNQGNPVGREKRLGFIRGLADTQLHGSGKVNFKIVAQGWGGWTNNGGLKAMEDILVAHPYINVLFAENDAMAMGALKAIREMNLQSKITIVGFDGQKDAYELLNNGQYGATAQNSPAILGKTVVETVARYLNGEENIKRITYTPSVLVERSNVAQFYDPNSLF
ncbi:substrate-binding domain-containing protein [Gynurincola endophyticus]|uniref:substrate-binding domain-containing protein n=1 Tax=Gynurincola endophyticus TaxID=2479004 RepID=UPI000F8C7376|nr:substrate-binding domain-containing protein [Gynurincola endophyticus]